MARTKAQPETTATTTGPLREVEVQPEPPATLPEVLNEPVSVQAFGRFYQIGRFNIGQLIKAMPHISPLGYLVDSASSGDVAQVLVDALRYAGQPSINLISIATSEPIEWLEEQEPLDGVELLTVIVEKNAKYFFYSANLKRLKEAGARLQAAVRKYGGSTSML